MTDDVSVFPSQLLTVEVLRRPFESTYNTSRFKRGIDPDSRFLSTLSQDRNLWIYLAVCAGLSSTAYWVIGSLTAALVAPVIIFQAINFHHYIVDGVIWKVRRKATQETLGIAT